MMERSDGLGKHCPPAENQRLKALVRRLRPMAFADEFGAFAKPYLGTAGEAGGYLLAGGYCLADVVETLSRADAEGRAFKLPPGRRWRNIASEGLERVTFHYFATLKVPPLLIGEGVQTATAILEPRTLAQGAKQASQARGWTKMLRVPLQAATETLHGAVGQPYARWVQATLASESGWVTQTARPAAQTLLKRHGPPLAKGLCRAARLVKAYNRAMILPALRAPGLPRALMRDAVQLGGRRAVQNLSGQKLSALLFLKPLPVLVGIAMVPLVADPFDEVMEGLLDYSLRLASGKNRLVLTEGRWKSLPGPQAEALRTIATTPPQPRASNFC